jgi:prepilin-type N-terminal cleavage/methylation domain-containing protein
MKKELRIKEAETFRPSLKNHNSLFLILNSRRRGFTLLEILIVIAVIGVIGSIVSYAFVQFKRASQLDVQVKQVISVIRLAQSKTLAAENDTVYGVHFESDQAVLFEGPVYVEAASTSEVTRLDALVQITGIALAGGGSEVIFDRLTGRTAEPGTVTLTGSESARVITIDASGQARAEAGTLAPQGTRITDTRHVQFDLGWSIQNASVMRLKFSDPPNPDTISDIVMAPFFSSGNAIYDWSGTVLVSGANQTLRIHTITMSPTSLSIDRDRRTNDKALTVYFLDDGIYKDVASYDAAGAVTVGLYGGTMSCVNGTMTCP